MAAAEGLDELRAGLGHEVVAVHLTAEEAGGFDGGEVGGAHGGVGGVGKERGQRHAPGGRIEEFQGVPPFESNKGRLCAEPSA